jgi:hypothetical protein
MILLIAYQTKSNIHIVSFIRSMWIDLCLNFIYLKLLFFFNYVCILFRIGINI